MCVRTARPFPAGSRLRVGFSEPEGQAVAEARVAWSRPDRSTPAMGLQLTRFEVGEQIFDRIVERAQRRADRLSRPEPWGDAPGRD